jgi:hypothetical protein
MDRPVREELAHGGVGELFSDVRRSGGGGGDKVDAGVGATHKVWSHRHVACTRPLCRFGMGSASPRVRRICVGAQDALYPLNPSCTNDLRIAFSSGSKRAIGTRLLQCKIICI